MNLPSRELSVRHRRRIGNDAVIDLPEHETLVDGQAYCGDDRFGSRGVVCRAVALVVGLNCLAAAGLGWTVLLNDSISFYLAGLFRCAGK